MSTIAMPSPDQEILDRKAEILTALSKVVAPDCLITDESETRAYECDALTAYRCPPMAVILPRTTEECAAVMKICTAYGVSIVPRGAGTSLSGGSLPTADSIILGTSRLNTVLETDYDNRFIRVQSGVTNMSVTDYVADDDFFYAPDPSSQIACAIAGNIAMNSGGPHCLKYGVTTNNLLGVRLVMADGEIVDIGGPAMDAPGLDLLGLICGSEGQLGIVTEATLRILPKPEGARPIMIAFDSAEVAGQCVGDIIKAGIIPVAIEYMDRPCIRLVERFVNAGYPMCEAMLIVEAEGSKTEIADQLDKISAIAKKLNPVEMRISQSSAESELIWKGRKSAGGAIGQVNDFITLDGTVPISALPQTLKRIAELGEKHGFEVANVFHAGDGNMHPMIMFDANKPGELEKAEALGSDILKACVDFGGCLTGEHGVGIEKRDMMTYQFSADDLEAQMQVKDVFDPTWILNPSKVFPLALSASRRNRTN